MTILDVSHGGMQIETPFALQLDSLHDFRISLGERSVVVKGRIAHCHIGELEEGVVIYRTGVEFVGDLGPRAGCDRTLRRSAQWSAPRPTPQVPAVLDGEIAEDPRLGAPSVRGGAT